MVELEPGWQPPTKLNVIAGALEPGGDPLPEGVSRDRVEEICGTARQLYGDYVDDLVAETELSRREAQTWALHSVAHEGLERLSFEAVGLYIWAVGRATEGEPLSRTVVTDYYDRATRKIARAEATMLHTEPPPTPAEVYEEPAPVWVDGPLVGRLTGRLGPEETYADLLERLLDETLSDVGVEEALAACRETGTEYVAVDTLGPDWDTGLRVLVRGPVPDNLADAEALRIDGEPRPVSVESGPDIEPEGSHLVCYDGRVTPEDGRDRLRTALSRVEGTLPDLVERVREAGAVGLAVDEEPAGAGAHLYPVLSDDPPTDPLAHLERLVLDERVLRVGRVTPVAAEDLPERATVLWASAEPLEERTLPEDPAERRERLPDRVLRATV